MSTSPMRESVPVDQLFGSESDAEDTRANNPSDAGDASDAAEGDADAAGALFSSDDEDEPAAPVESAAPPVTVRLPRIAPPTTHGASVFLAKLPPLLRIEATPFDANTYEAAANREDAFRRVEGTLRWRYKRQRGAGDDGTAKESNARFVRWSDGSLSLLIGRELVMVQQHRAHGFHYVAAAHEEQGFLQARGALDHQIALVPLPKPDRPTYLHHYASDAVNTGDSPPRGRTSAAAAPAARRAFASTSPPRRHKSTATKLVIMDANPEKVRLEAEKAEREKLRLRRRLAARRRNERDRVALNARFLEAGSGHARADFSDDEAGPAPAKMQLDEYEKDDFVVSDDDVDISGSDDDSAEAAAPRAPAATVTSFAAGAAKAGRSETEGDSVVSSDDDAADTAAARRRARRARGVSSSSSEDEGLAGAVGDAADERLRESRILAAKRGASGVSAAALLEADDDD